MVRRDSVAIHAILVAKAAAMAATLNYSVTTLLYRLGAALSRYIAIACYLKH